MQMGDSMHVCHKWIQQIVDLQHDDGSWGCFHSLSQPTKEQPMTTEQALRRLHILGLTKDDEPIARALAYMEHNLKQPYPTVFHEKKHDSKTYGDLMLAAWIRLFDPDNETALIIAAMEVLSAYPLAPQKLGFVVEWLKSQQDENGQWDMGSVVRDGIHFPLSESWRKADDRKRDCTARIGILLRKLEA
ncbi:MAG: hypothetical protein VB070_07105 [Clostridiaceae bacterium]|nr:hypothetical protein [Clostridiaceae bacterium]